MSSMNTITVNTITHGSITVEKSSISSPPSQRFYGEIGGSRCSADLSSGSYAMSVKGIGQVGLNAPEAVQVNDWLNS